jgi:hypothetical protein
MRKILTVCFLLLAGAAAAAGDVLQWRTYVNERFGTAIEYPGSIFKAEPWPDNGDGLVFKSRDGAEFTVSASYNALSDNVQSLEQSLRHPASGGPDQYTNVTYRLSQPGLLVLSGFRGDRVYYEKFLFGRSQETIHQFAIVYPRATKSIYDPIVERMSKSMTFR